MAIPSAATLVPYFNPPIPQSMYWWINLISRLYSWPLLSDHIPLTQSLGGACCFDRPSQSGVWYTCPVVIVRSSLDEVRSIRVVFAVKYIYSCVCVCVCVCASTTFEHLITRSYCRCNGSFGDMLHSTHGIGGTRNIVVHACPNTNRLVCENGVTVIRRRTTNMVI